MPTEWDRLDALRNTASGVQVPRNGPAVPGQGGFTPQKPPDPRPTPQPGPAGAPVGRPPASGTQGAPGPAGAQPGPEKAGSGVVAGQFDQLTALSKAPKEGELPPGPAGTRVAEPYVEPPKAAPPMDTPQDQAMKEAGVPEPVDSPAERAAKMARARKAYGKTPFDNDPSAPKPPVSLVEGSNFNPFDGTGTWS